MEEARQFRRIAALYNRVKQPKRIAALEVETAIEPSVAAPDAL